MSADVLAPEDEFVGATSGRAPDKAKLRNNIIVRTIEERDRVPAREIVRRLHQKSIFGDIPFSNTKWNKGVDIVLAKPANRIGLIAELRGKPVGCAHASVGEYLIGDGEILTSVHFIAVDTEFCGKLLSGKIFLRLIQGVKAWSKTRSSKRTIMHVTSGVKTKSTDRLIRAAGGVLIGGDYVV